MSQKGPILVIGRSGQLANALAELNGNGVVALGRPDVDITLRNSLENAIKRIRPALVINAAAYTAVDNAQTDERQAFAINADGPAVLAALCARYNFPLIHVSTDYVFDGCKTAPYGEDDLPAPLGVYGASKRAGEIAICKACPQHIIVRTAWVHSAMGKNFVKTMLSLASTRDEISVVDDQFGNPTFAPHLGQAILGIAEHILENSDFENWGVYHLAGAGRTSWADFAKEVFAASKRLNGPYARVLTISSEHYNKAFQPAAPRPENSCMDCHKAHDRFGILIQDWRDGVHDCVKAILSLK